MDYSDQKEKKIHLYVYERVWVSLLKDLMLLVCQIPVSSTYNMSDWTQLVEICLQYCSMHA